MHSNIKLRSETFSISALNECDQNKLILKEKREEINFLKRRRRGECHMGKKYFQNLRVFIKF